MNQKHRIPRKTARKRIWPDCWRKLKDVRYVGKLVVSENVLIDIDLLSIL